MSRNIFDNVSTTGIQVLILRDVGKCDCIKNNINGSDTVETDDYFGLLNNNILGKEDITNIVDDIELADPNCNKCYGTGVNFFKILSNKVRFSNSTSTNAGDGGELERQDFKLLKDDMIFLYVPYYYNFLTLKDYIGILETDDVNEIKKPIKLLNLYKIVNINEYVDGDFKYFRVNLDKKKVI